MKKASAFSILFLAAGLGLSAQTGQQFPALKGETMNDKTLTIPADTKGKFTIVCMAYSEDAEKELHTWFEPAYDKFIAKSGMMDDAFDVNLFFVPMFTGAKAAAAGAAKKKIVAETDATLPADAAPVAEQRLEDNALDFDLGGLTFEPVASTEPIAMAGPGRDAALDDTAVPDLDFALDPITPPHRANAAAKHMPRAQHVIVANAGHGVSQLGCAPRLLRAFLDKPQDKLDAACMNEIPAPTFQLGSAGPQP